MTSLLPWSKNCFIVSLDMLICTNLSIPLSLSLCLYAYLSSCLPAYLRVLSVSVICTFNVWWTDLYFCQLEYSTCYVSSQSDLFWFNLSGARLDTSHDDYPEDGFEQLLPRPLLVIKGTTPTAVTLEWEWTLLPEQIAGADIVYSVLTLGSKFHSNVNSSFW